MITDVIMQSAPIIGRIKFVGSNEYRVSTHHEDGTEFFSTIVVGFDESLVLLLELMRRWDEHWANMNITMPARPAEREE